MEERIVDILRLVGGGVSVQVRIADLCAGLFQHVADAGASPRTHPQKNVVRISHGIQPHHRRVGPAVDRDVGRICCRRLATGGCAAEIAFPGRRGRFPHQRKDANVDKACQHKCDHPSEKRRRVPGFVQIHLNQSLIHALPETVGKVQKRYMLKRAEGATRPPCLNRLPPPGPCSCGRPPAPWRSSQCLWDHP